MGHWRQGGGIKTRNRMRYVANETEAIDAEPTSPGFGLVCLVLGGCEDGQKVKIDGRQRSQVVVISTTGCWNGKPKEKRQDCRVSRTGQARFSKKPASIGLGNKLPGKGGVCVEGGAKRTSQQPATKGPLAGGDNGQLGLGGWN